VLHGDPACGQALPGVHVGAVDGFKRPFNWRRIGSSGSATATSFRN